LEKLLYPLIAQLVVDEQPILVIRDYIGLPQHPQLLGDVSLWSI